MRAAQVLLGTLVAAALSFLPAPATAEPCPSTCATLRLDPCVGAFADGYSPQDTLWTLTYTDPVRDNTVQLYGRVPPPASTSPICHIPGCYEGTLTNTLGFHDHQRQCIE